MNSWMPFNAVCDGTSLVDMIEKEKSRFKKPTLSEEQLEAVSGGVCTSSTKCPKCGCRSFDWGESCNRRRYYCCRCHTFVYEVYFGD